jgi:hypothetical protein
MVEEKILEKISQFCHLSTHEVIGATQGITSAFFYGIFIITIKKSWNYKNKICVINLSLKIYLVVIYEGI